MDRPNDRQQWQLELGLNGTFQNEQIRLSKMHLVGYHIVIRIQEVEAGHNEGRTQKLLYRVQFYRFLLANIRRTNPCSSLPMTRELSKKKEEWKLFH